VPQGGLKKKFSKRGDLAMGNTGKNSNTSQFFMALDAQPKLSGKHGPGQPLRSL
jgi:cyclophilin family peptidyl-prolyl cis-trans isomerase